MFQHLYYRISRIIPLQHTLHPSIYTKQCHCYHQERKHVVVGMSGGVDSSVAAYLLKKQGYQVTGVYMKNWDATDEIAETTCPYDEEYKDVCKVGKQLNIPITKVDLSRPYWNSVFLPFLEHYQEGFTPNPDMLCNREIKFQAFIQFALSLHADYIATGHYAQLKMNETGQNPQLFCGTDPDKDQSYFLSFVQGQHFKQVLFPVGHLLKSQVRQVAMDAKLSTAYKRESMGICFIGKRKFKDFLHTYITPSQGYFKTLDGHIIARHDGYSAYTIGQNARISGQLEKYFVVGKKKNWKGSNTVSKDILAGVCEDSPKDTYDVIVAANTSHPALYSDVLFVAAEKFNWIAGEPPRELLQPNGALKCTYRVRYRQELGQCIVSLVSYDNVLKEATALQDLNISMEEEISPDRTFLRIEFCSPQRGVTCEQALVLYHESESLVYGGGPIAVAGITYEERNKALPDDVSDWRSS